MRAIIIDDKDANDLVRRLSLAKLNRPGRFHVEEDVTMEDMHRVFHLEVVRWLQDQGADLK